MLQMRWVDSYTLKSNVFSLFPNMSSEMSGARSSAGRLFQTRSPWTAGRLFQTRGPWNSRKSVPDPRSKTVPDPRSLNSGKTVPDPRSLKQQEDCSRPKVEDCSRLEVLEQQEDCSRLGPWTAGRLFQTRGPWTAGRLFQTWGPWTAKYGNASLLCCVLRCSNASTSSSDWKSSVNVCCTDVKLWTCREEFDRPT